MRRRAGEQALNYLQIERLDENCDTPVIPNPRRGPTPGARPFFGIQTAWPDEDEGCNVEGGP